MLRFGMIAVLGSDEACVAEVVAMLRLLCSWVEGNYWIIRRSEKLERVRTD